MITNKNTKNIIYTLLGQIIVLGLALIVPRCILTVYGSDANGLLSTVGQIIAYLTLLEAGIGQAARNELYQLFQTKELNMRKITSVMAASGKAYRSITKLYALLVVVLSIVLPFVIKTDIDRITIFLVILIEGISGMISLYFVQNHANLLIVDGKQYVNSNIDMVIKVFIYLIKIVMALLGLNIILIEIGYLIATIVKVLIYERYMRTHYNWIDFKSDYEYMQLKDRNSYLISEVAWTVFSSTDMIIISVFCSTKSASVYAIYYMIFMTINKLVDALFTSIKYNLGQNYHKDIEHYISIHDMFNSVFLGSLSTLLLTAYYLCIPFVSLYTSGVNDIEYVDKALPMGFCLMLLLSWCRMVSEHLIGVAGYAKRLRVVSIVEVLTNITLSVIMVNRFGVSGVLYATVAALIVKTIYCNWLADRVILKRRITQTIKIIFANLLLFVIISACRSLFDIKVSSYGELLLYGAIITICSTGVYFIANFIINRNSLLFVKRFLTGGKS